MTKPREKTREELTAEIEEGKKKIRQYENREKCNRGYAPTVRNVHLKNVTCEKSKLGVLIIGLDDDKHVYNVSVEDSRFNNVKEGKNRISGAKDVTFKNLYINGELVK